MQVSFIIWKTYWSFMHDRMTADFPVVSVDELSKDLHEDVHEPLPARSGKEFRQDYHYRRKGVCQIFMAFEPLAGVRYVYTFRRKRGKEFAEFLKMLAIMHYPDCKKILLVLDNYATHKLKVLYDHFSAPEARALVERFQVHYTPVHASWLNPVEPELSVLSRQCLNRRLSDMAQVESEVKSWQEQRNSEKLRFNWKFEIGAARKKLSSVYPIIVSE